MPEAVVFIHSTGMGPFMWRELTSAVPAGLTVACPTLRGYAPNDRLTAGMPYTLADEFQHLRSQWPSDVDGVHLVAHSFGGFLSLLLARQSLSADWDGPSIRSLWLYEPVLFGSLEHQRQQTPLALPEAVRTELALLYDNPSIFDEDAGGSDAWIGAFIDYWNGPGAWAAASTKVREAGLAVGWKMFQEVKTQAEHRRSFDEFQVELPLTLVHGGQTRAAATEMARQLQAVNPHAHAECLEDLGHMSVTNRPDRIIPSLRAHWDRLGLAPR